MKDQAKPAVQELLSRAEFEHAAASDRLRVALAAEKAGTPLPAPANMQGHTVVALAVDAKKKAALRGVFATVALDGAEAQRFGLGLRDCLSEHSQAIANAHKRQITDIFPGIHVLTAFAIEDALIEQGVNFKAHRVRSLLKPKS